MYQRMTRQNKTKWDSMLKTIEISYNDTINGSQHASPNDLEEDSKDKEYHNGEDDGNEEDNSQNGNKEDENIEIEDSVGDPVAVSVEQ